MKHANGETLAHLLRLISCRHCEPQAKQPRGAKALKPLGCFVAPGQARGFSQ